MKSYRLIKVADIQTLACLLNRKVAHVLSDEVRIEQGIASNPDALAADARAAMLQVQEYLEDLEIDVKEWLRNRDVE